MASGLPIRTCNKQAVDSRAYPEEMLARTCVFLLACCEILGELFPSAIGM